MKRIAAFFAALFCTVGLFAQTSKIPNVREIVTVENENNGHAVEVVNIPVDGVNHYWLDLGQMGIGDKVIQFNVDIVTILYIPLGDNLTEAIKTMEELKTLFDEPKGTMREIQGSFKPLFPGEELETVKVYKFKPLLTNQLQFVIERENHERVTHIDKSDFNALLRGMKLYGKLHKSEM